MSEAEFHTFPGFRNLPLYEESDARSHALADGRPGVRECSTTTEVNRCLADRRLVPLGAVRAGYDGSAVVVVYFAEAS